MNLIDKLIPLKVKLFDHQKEAYRRGMNLDHIALLMEQGTGKTLSAIAIMGSRYHMKQISRVLVVAPLAVVGVWSGEDNEFDRFADFPCDVRGLDGNRSERRKLRQSPEYLFPKKKSAKLQVTVINYDNVKLFEKVIKRWKPDIIVLDESQRIKSRKTERSKVLHRLGRIAKHRMILSGTPITQSPLDLWSQYRFLDPSIFGISYSSFESRYAKKGGYMNYKIKGYKRLKELTKKAYTIAYRVTKEECLDLPPFTDQVLYCDLESKSRKAYDEMEEEMVVSLNGFPEYGELLEDIQQSFEYNPDDEGIEWYNDTYATVAPIILTQMLRLQQIVGGFLPVDDPWTLENEEKAKKSKHIITMGKEKLDLFQDLLEDFPMDKKLVVFARFIPEIDAMENICKKLKRSTVRLTGSTKEPGKTWKSFQYNPDPKVILIQIQTGGLGITLTAADTVIFYSTNFSYADYEQARARVHRISQVNRVNYIHLVARNTIDEVILEALQNKRRLAELVIDKYKEESQRRNKGMAKKKVTTTTVSKKKSKMEELGTITSSEERQLEDALANLKVQIEELPEKDLKKAGEKVNIPEVEDDPEENKAIEQAQREAAASKRKSSNDEEGSYDGPVVTIKDLADELDIPPAQLRKQLRNSNLKKPGGRWEWPTDHKDLTTIRGWKK